MSASRKVRTFAGRLRRGARRAHNRLRRASAILLYHRVAEGFPDPWSLCVSPANFHAHMAVLAARGVVSLDALADDLAGGRRRRSVVVTFDDGYADFHATALPVLQAHGIGTTLFVASGALDGGEFWWDELERIVLAFPRLPNSLYLEITREPFTWQAGSDGDRRALHLALHRRIGRLSGAERARVLGELRHWAGVPDLPRATHRPLSVAELASVAGSGLVQVGAHTVSHSYLSGLAEHEQAEEIATSKARLEAIVQAPVEHFSYPHGDCAAAALAAVRAAGFRIACTSDGVPVTAEADVLALPRIEVPNLPGAAFARWLDEWVG